MVSSGTERKGPLTCGAKGTQKGVFSWKLGAIREMEKLYGIPLRKTLKPIRQKRETSETRTRIESNTNLQITLNVTHQNLNFFLRPHALFPLMTLKMEKKLSHTDALRAVQLTGND